MAEVSLQPNPESVAYKELTKFAKQWNQGVAKAYETLWDTEPMKTGPDRPILFFERQLLDYWDYHQAYETQIGVD
jgi:hypothetical protein